MKLPLKHITLLVMLSLTGIFAYQVYWLTGLYRTMNRNLQQQIAEGMRMADYNEMILRLERLSSDSTEHGTIQVDAGLSNDNYYLQSRVTRSGQPAPSEQTASDTLVVSATDSMKTREDTRWSKALLKMNEGMNVVLQKQDNMQRLAQYFQKGLHAGIDEVLPTQLADYDSLLWEQLKPLNLQVPYQLLQLHSGARYDGSGAYTDTLARLSTPGYRPSADAHRFTCYLDVHNHRAYELTLEPIDSIVLQQMKGILVTSLIILIILSGAFGYLIPYLIATENPGGDEKRLYQQHHPRTEDPHCRGLCRQRCAAAFRTGRRQRETEQVPQHLPRAAATAQWTGGADSVHEHGTAEDLPPAPGKTAAQRSNPAAVGTAPPESRQTGAFSGRYRAK